MVEALDASPSKGSPTSWKWYGCGLLALLFLLLSEGVELFSVKRATRAPSKRIAFVVLTDPRENHEENVIPMLAHVESKYGWTGHPYYIFIDKELPTEAVMNATRDATNGKAQWHLIDESVGWGKPDWINSDVLNLAVPEQYHHFFPVGYHNMCRFFGGFAYSHPALASYDYFWRLDSNVRYLCAPPYDPAQYVADNDLDYGFIHAEPDAVVTLDGFGDMLKRFLAQDSTARLIHPQSNYKRWLFNEQDEYTFASVYNNFEIVSRRFFESEAYQTWFRFVDRNSTGIYSRRYGDAPIRTAGLSMFVDPKKVAWFGRQIGYEHEWMLAVPEEPWKSMYCDELPSMQFKLPANSHLEWFGDETKNEPEFDARWLFNR